MVGGVTLSISQIYQISLVSLDPLALFSDDARLVHDRYKIESEGLTVRRHRDIVESPSSRQGSAYELSLEDLSSIITPIISCIIRHPSILFLFCSLLNTSFMELIQ